MSKQAFKRVRRSLSLPVNRKSLPAYTDIGGYPISYLCRDGGTLCAGCVNRDIDLVDESTRHREYRNDSWVVVACFANYEDENLCCDHCGDQIHAAYAD